MWQRFADACELAMRYATEYRDAASVNSFVEAIDKICTQHWVLMEVCGGQTNAIIKYGLDELLPEKIELIHGPGCPVCVTPVKIIDYAIALAQQPHSILCTYADMLQVPGTNSSLAEARSEGAQLHVMYSPLDAIAVAQQNPDSHIVVLAVGFESTAPAHALFLQQARQRKLKNLSVLLSHFRVPPALREILANPENRVQAFLAAGHVCSVMGYREYEPIAQQYQVPIVVTGFEPIDILQGIYHCVKQLEGGQAKVENQYARAVTRKGNSTAQAAIADVFEYSDRQWRGIGGIADSGFKLRNGYKMFEPEFHFPGLLAASQETHGGSLLCTSTSCLSGEIMTGLKKPPECTNFGEACTPEKPLGAPMVTSEGACHTYFRYRQTESNA